MGLNGFAGGYLIGIAIWYYLSINYNGITSFGWGMGFALLGAGISWAIEEIMYLNMCLKKEKKKYMSLTLFKSYIDDALDVKEKKDE